MGHSNIDFLTNHKDNVLIKRRKLLEINKTDKLQYDKWKFWKSHKAYYNSSKKEQQQFKDEALTIPLSAFLKGGVYESNNT